MTDKHLMSCGSNKIYRNLRHNDTVIGFVTALHKDFEAKAICAQNGNVLENRMQPDIELKYKNKVCYLDITYVANNKRLEEAFQNKIKKYEQYGKIIPVVIEYNGVIYGKSIKLLEEITKD